MHSIVDTSKKNNSHGFDVLRLVAAAMVIYGHAFPLTGLTAPGFLGNSIQTLGVKIFFVISGFLITRSWLALPQWRPFLLKRALRIWPALLVNVALAALMLGPLFTSLSLQEYFASASPWHYLRNGLLYPVYGLAGVFEVNTYKYAVNGSLWSLPVEVMMYLAVPLLVARTATASAGSSQFRSAFVALALVTLSLAYVRLAPPPQPLVVYGTAVGSLLDVACYFWLGSAMSFVGDAALVGMRSVSAAVLFCGFFVQHPVLSEVYLALVLPILIVSIGLSKVPGWEHVMGSHDYSYGLYLYGFPVQQAVVAVVDTSTPMSNFYVSLPFVLMFAIASWHMVERPAIRLKSRLPQHVGVFA